MADFDFLLAREWIKLPLVDADIYYCENYLPKDQARSLFNHLFKEIAWQESIVRVFGKTYLAPRLSALYGDDGLSYRYSGHLEQAKNWLPVLSELRQRLNDDLNCNFNSVLANLYRNGNDANGWHADNEAELGKAPVIASLSFGAPRDFQLKHRSSRQGESNLIKDKLRYDIELSAGSALLMAGATQSQWLHCIPKRKRCTEPRINLTYRHIKNLA